MKRRLSEDDEERNYTFEDPENFVTTLLRAITRRQTKAEAMADNEGKPYVARQIPATRVDDGYHQGCGGRLYRLFSRNGDGRYSVPTGRSVCDKCKEQYLSAE